LLCEAKSSSVRAILKVVLFCWNFTGPSEFHAVGKEYNGDLLKDSLLAAGIMKSLELRRLCVRARFAFFGQVEWKDVKA
jgi:hypothetical protein